MVTQGSDEGGNSRPSGRMIGVGIGIVAIVALIAGLAGGEAEVASTTTIRIASDTTLAPPVASNQLAPLDCWDLLSANEMFSALGADENPEIVDGADGFSQAEVCRQTLEIGANYFVEISPGGPSDFALGTTLLGVTGQEVAGVADRALWFGGDDAEGSGEYGVLAVNQLSEYGRVYARIFFGRPNVDPDTQRELAVGLAALALPRFPGVGIDQPIVEPEVFVFPELPAPDTSDMSMDEFLFAKEAEGAWSFEEGLISMLSLLANEATVDEVLGDTELADTSGSMIMLLAARYLETGEDQAVKERITQLVDQLTFSDEELAQVGVQTAPHDLLVSVIPIAAEAPGDGCVGTDAFDCLQLVVMPERAGVTGSYLLYVPIDESTDWTQQYIDAVTRTILDSAAKFEPLGKMPNDLRVFLLPDGGQTYASQGPDDCGIYVGEREASDSLGSGIQFQQRIAQYMAQCFLASEFWDLVIASDPQSWWFNALAVYLSGYVYPEANLEHVQLPSILERLELSTGVSSRSTLNWAFFEYLHSEIGVRGNLSLIEGLTPGNDGFDDVEGQIDLVETLHLFELGLTDADIKDLDGPFLPFRPQASEFVVIAPVKATLQVPASGVRRVHIKVTDGKQACYSIQPRGDNAYSLRPGAPGEDLEWPELPEFLQGEMTLVVTAVEAGTELDLIIHEVVEDESCAQDEELPPPAPLDCGLCPPSQYFHNE
ncbi:MAG: hypothetical protein WBM90_12680 [Acidimicrobiia bacterium]